MRQATMEHAGESGAQFSVGAEMDGDDSLAIRSQVGNLVISNIECTRGHLILATTF